jgi:hypothetical protein
MELYVIRITFSFQLLEFHSLMNIIIGNKADLKERMKVAAWIDVCVYQSRKSILSVGGVRGRMIDFTTVSTLATSVLFACPLVDSRNSSRQRYTVC